ncbi:hypothetical protein ACA910_021853 [Epithemia clementina (nom. ined.)]
MDPPAPFHPTATRRARTTVRVGVGVIVAVPNRPGYIYAGIRKGSHGAGSLALPGGHLEMYESWFDCAKREVMEEMNLSITNLQFGHVTNDIMRDEEKHYITIFVMAQVAPLSGGPETMEPDKCQGWKEYSWDDLLGFIRADKKGQEESSAPPRLFGPLKNLIQEQPENVLKYIGQPTPN